MGRSVPILNHLEPARFLKIQDAHSKSCSEAITRRRAFQSFRGRICLNRFPGRLESEFESLEAGVTDDGVLRQSQPFLETAKRLRKLAETNVRDAHERSPAANCARTL